MDKNRNECYLLLELRGNKESIKINDTVRNLLLITISLVQTFFEPRQKSCLQYFY